ncbi:hypothetical protein JTB14_033661 [Gonioctena quinquepunctata]|nr:hypothetical protein JTB14_033661 [Gonioctena quinquepunctata]
MPFRSEVEVNNLHIFICLCVCEYLRGWELPALIPTFEEQQIDVDVFENLNDEELIPVLGFRKKFLKKYNEFKSVQEALLHPAIMENSGKDDNFSESVAQDSKSGQKRYTDAENSNITTDANIYLNLEKTILWLKNNIEPTNEVTEKWKVTFSQRMNEKDTIEQYYRKFPCLSQPLGYLLLQNDFNQMYPERENSLFIKYPQMAVKIHKILQERKDSFIEEKLKIFQETHPEPTEGEPASLREETHPDWVPSINMGYEINHGNSHVCDRYKRLQVFHMDKLDMVVC